MVMSVASSKYGQDMDQLIHAVVITEIMEVLMISLCVKVNCFRKSIGKPQDFVKQALVR